jgi:septal ring-binding cell division protein DamX
VLEKPLDMATGIGADDRPKPRAAAPLLWLLAILAAGVAVVVLMRGRGSAPETGRLAPVLTPTTVEVAAIAEPEPTIAASLMPTAAPVAAAAAPTKAPHRPTPAAAPIGREAAGGDLSRQAWVDRATRDQQRARADRKAHFTIQLELACEVASLTDAWKHDRPAGTMWVLSTPFQGRTCFRVLWGRYPTREAARRGLANIPSFFSTPRNHPIVTAIH